VRPSGSLRHLQGSFVGIIAASGPERSTYPTVRICAATSVALMNLLIKTLVISVVFAAPIASFAQADQPMTRAEVRNQLIELEKAGYNPGRAGRDPYYPADIQAAEARVAAEKAAASSVGGATGGSSQSGSR
jgi:hypothetical protein